MIELLHKQANQKLFNIEQNFYVLTEQLSSLTRTKKFKQFIILIF